MKHSAPAAVVVLLGLASLSSCGQRGPLYLPPPDVPPHSTAPAQPVPPVQPPPAIPKMDDKKDQGQNGN